jgi:hypothetical protein
MNFKLSSPVIASLRSNPDSLNRIVTLYERPDCFVPRNDELLTEPTRGFIPLLFTVIVGVGGKGINPLVGQDTELPVIASLRSNPDSLNRIFTLYERLDCFVPRNDVYRHNATI